MLFKQNEKITQENCQEQQLLRLPSVGSSILFPRAWALVAAIVTKAKTSTVEITLKDILTTSQSHQKLVFFKVSQIHEKVNFLQIIVSEIFLFAGRRMLLRCALFKRRPLQKVDKVWR